MLHIHRACAVFWHHQSSMHASVAHSHFYFGACRSAKHRGLLRRALSATGLLLKSWRLPKAGDMCWGDEAPVEDILQTESLAGLP